MFARRLFGSGSRLNGIMTAPASIVGEVASAVVHVLDMVVESEQVAPEE